MGDMIFKRTTGLEAPVAALTDTLTKHLGAGEQVLWLLSGGSAIEVAVAVASRLRGVDVSKLVVTLADERFGPIGHTDSNWFQLQKAGFMVAGVRLIPVLDGSDLVSTARQFAGTLSRELRDANYKIALLGIGPDGHTSGILPDTEAVNATELATSYVTEQYKRVTSTNEALKLLDEAVVYSMGDSKKEALENLQKDLPPMQQPAQFLKNIPKVTIYNDQIGDPA